MARFAFRRLVAMVSVLFAIAVLAFLICTVIPNGDPAERLAGHNASPVQIEAIRHQWGFDRSVPVQYLKMMENIFNGDLISYANHVNVIDQIRQDIPHTLSLAIGAAIIWMIFAIALGVYSAMRVGKFSD